MKINKEEIFSWAKVIVLAVAISFVINNFLIVKAQVPTGSMENTVMTDDRIVAFRLSYLMEQPQRGDVVVFKFPDDESENYLKRIIGLPGEVVEIIEGKVYINYSKEPLKEGYLKEMPIGTFGPYDVPEDSYFMLGDNRNGSIDSRFWENTYVHEDKIIGKVIFRFHPSLDTIK